MDIGSSETELSCTRLQDDVFGAPEVLELLCDLECAVRGSVVDNDDFPVKIACEGFDCQFIILPACV